MDSEAFRKYGKEMVDLVADYWDSMRERQPLPDVKPGYIWDMVPKDPPEKPEDWKQIFADIDPVVLSKNTNWHHPHFFAYFSTACSYPAIMADILSGGMASVGFSWKSSPSMTELEMVTTDWIAKAVGLPDFFLNSDSGPGAGVIQNSASDATFIAILSARARAVASYKKDSMLSGLYSTISKTLSMFYSTDQNNNVDPVITFENHDAGVINKLVAYCSDQAHSSVDKGVMLAGVKLRKLKTVIGGQLKTYYVEGATLEEAIKEDRARGLIPFIYVATVGMTTTCGSDDLKVIGPICNKENLWLHVDAAYAGSFAICPEYRYLLNGIEYVDSFNFNVDKAMEITFDCSPMWFKNAKEASQYFNVEAEYLKHEHQAITTDYRHLQIALGRRFRSLKIWFVFRSLGIEHLQSTLRKRVKLAEEFAELISKDEEFEIIVPPHLGLVCFRHKSNNDFNEKLLAAINDDYRIHLVGTKVHDIFYLRLAICSVNTVSSDVMFAYQVIKEILKLPIAVIVVIDKSTNIDNYIVAQNSLECYCKYFDYPLFRVFVDQNTSLSVKCPTNDFMFKRHCIVKELMLENPDYEYFFFFDSDIGVVNPNHLLEEYINVKSDVVILQKIFGFEFMTESYIVKNTPFARDFLTDWYLYEKKLSNNHYGSDNAAIHQIFLDRFNPRKASFCKYFWQESKNWANIWQYMACARYYLGRDYSNFRPIEIRQKGEDNVWTRDGWLTSSRWAPKDFLLNGWKTHSSTTDFKKWYSPLIPSESETGFDLQKCSTEKIMENWVYKDTFIKENWEINQVIQKIIQYIEKRFNKMVSELE